MRMVNNKAPACSKKIKANYYSVKKLLFILVLLCSHSVTIAQEAVPNREKRDILIREYQAQRAEGAVFQVEAWRAAEKKRIDDSLAELPAEVKEKLLSQAREALAAEWTHLPLTLFLEFTENGNRNHYESRSWARRRKLLSLTIGELLEHRGNYLPEIANGLWLIMEESTWSFPAFLYLQKEGYGLPDPSEPIIDLTTAETAATVAWIYFLLQDELSAVSPILNKKVRFELDRRIFTPYLDRDDFWWMGFSKVRRVNNWNVWINSNVFLTTLLGLDDEERRNQIFEKTLRSTDYFINDYPEDGGCDEGPSYWGVAGGALGQYLALLTELSENRLNFADNELLHHIGTYIYKMHVDSNRVVNFADAAPFHVPDPAKVYAFATVFEDERLSQFAAYCYSISPLWKSGYSGRDMNAFINNLLVEKELRQIPAQAPLLQQSWLPDLQVLALRQQEGSARGLFLGAKGGHNGESHNHNDVGNFVLYQDGDPIIIDLGPATYRKETFSEERWNIWNFQSQWHNCPIINGVQQKNGRSFTAQGTILVKNKEKTTLSMDLAKAYPEEAQVRRWKREFVFDAAQGTLTLNEAYQLKEWKQPCEINFVLVHAPDLVQEGRIKLTDKEGTKSVYLHYDPKKFSVHNETKVLEDDKLKSAWGNQVYRLTLRSRQNKLEGSHSLLFKDKP